MEYQYLTNEGGQPIAVVVPLEEWEALQSKIKDDFLSDNEIKEAEQSWSDYLNGKGGSVNEVYKELIEDRND